MSWDLDEAEAVELAEEYLAAMEPPADDVWVVTHVEEHDWGWVVSWLNKRAAEGSAETRDLYAGGGPFLVDRKSGRLAICGSAHAVDHYIQAWHRGELPDRPRRRSWRRAQFGNTALNSARPRSTRHRNVFCASV